MPILASTQPLTYSLTIAGTRIEFQIQRNGGGNPPARVEIRKKIVLPQRGMNDNRNQQMVILLTHSLIHSLTHSLTCKASTIPSPDDNSTRISQDVEGHSEYPGERENERVRRQGAVQLANAIITSNSQGSYSLTHSLTHSLTPSFK